ncbi:sulfatase [Portibacter marinus]|uniref:sulfatase n=1 Tax=Portibacter marinus TaxID=2898660 RepID=UPI001F329EF8|nr:sulfatase [Portibacter marinus]
MKHFSLIFLLLFIVAAKLTCQKALEKPNIVFILIDDLGWADLGFMGNTIYDTPHLDQLASRGMVFNQAYAPAANCAPSRACIMSGKNTPSHGIYTVGNSERGKSEDRKLIPIKNKTVLEDSIFTIGDFLQSHGYVTASMGKWHLGDSPLTQGFDVNVGGFKAGHPKSYFSPYKNPELEDGPKGENLTDRLTDEALKFVNANKNKPFFLYLPHYTVHTPLQGKEELVSKYEKIIGDDERYDARYGAMVENMDANVGRLLEGLEIAGVAEKTMIIFFSDNGGLSSISRQTPLRAGKGSYYEGGIRVPMVVKWPGKVKPGIVSNEMVSGLDIFPTLVEVMENEQGFEFDGVSLVELLLEEKPLSPRSLYFHFPIYLQAYNQITDDGRDPLFRTRPGSVIRKGNWKLHEYFEDGSLELYDLSKDVGERNNLIKAYPEKVEELHQLLKSWRVKSKASIPSESNPLYQEK